MPGGQCTGSRWDVAGDWENGIPTTGDPAIFPRTNTNDITDPGAAADNVDLSVLTTNPGFKGDIGSSGTPIEGAFAFLNLMGDGDVFVNCAKNSGAELDCNEARINTSPAARVELGGQTADKGEFDLLELISALLTLKGSIAFKSDCVVTMVSASANLTIEAAAALLPRLEQKGGVSKVSNVVSEIIMYSGECEKLSNKAGIIKINDGARMIYNHAAIAGEVTRVIVYPGGIFDLLEDGQKKVIDQVIEWPGAEVRWDKVRHTITDYIRLNESGRRVA